MKADLHLPVEVQVAEVAMMVVRQDHVAMIRLRHLVAHLQNPLQKALMI